MGALALGLGILTVTGLVQLWHVYVFAFLLGCVTAFDSPARQTFVSELVGEADLSNAVALNSTSFNAARMIGPAIAGVLIAAVGSGWVFLINAASFAAVLCSLEPPARRRSSPAGSRAVRTRGSLVEGFRYVWKRPDLRAILLMLFLIGTFGLNFPIFISTMSVTVFHAGAGQYGLLTSIMAIGTVAGALLAAGGRSPASPCCWPAPRCSGSACALAAVMPNYWLFGLALVIIGVSAQTFTTTAQQHCATLDRARHARTRDGDPPRHRAGRHARRRAHRRSGSPIRSARAGRSASARPRASPRRSSGSTTSRSTVTCACASTLDASASVSTRALECPPIRPPMRIRPKPHKKGT